MHDHSQKFHHLPSSHDREMYFKLHVDHSHEHHKAPLPQKTEENKHHQPHPHKSHQKPHRVKEIFHDAFRQIIASILFLVIGFFLLNWSSYSQIFLSRWDRFWNPNQETPLTELINKDVIIEKETLKVSSNPEVQKKQIPDLNLEVAPIDNRIIIPRINQNIPIVRVSSESLIRRDWGALEAEMQEALQDGVVHYPGTSLPGQTGNVVVTGHSSYFPWDPGRFKDVFALLHDVEMGDKIVVYYKQTKYTYEVDNIEIVLPEDIDVLKQTPYNKLTLITCTPVGTNLKRLIVSAKPIAINDKPIDTATAKIAR